MGMLLQCGWWTVLGLIAQRTLVVPFIFKLRSESCWNLIYLWPHDGTAESAAAIFSLHPSLVIHPCSDMGKYLKTSRELDTEVCFCYSDCCHTHRLFPQWRWTESTWQLYNESTKAVGFDFLWYSFRGPLIPSAGMGPAMWGWMGAGGERRAEGELKYILIGE